MFVFSFHKIEKKAQYIGLGLFQQNQPISGGFLLFCLVDTTIFFDSVLLNLGSNFFW